MSAHPLYLSDAGVAFGYAAYITFIISYVVAVMKSRDQAACIFALGACITAVMLLAWFAAVMWGIFTILNVLLLITQGKRGR